MKTENNNDNTSPNKPKKRTNMVCRAVENSLLEIMEEEGINDMPEIV